MRPRPPGRANPGSSSPSIPHQLGFRPRDSAVAVSLRPPRGRGRPRRPRRPGRTSRTPTTARGSPGRSSRTSAGTAPAGAVLVLYTDRDPRGRDGAPGARGGARTSARPPQVAARRRPGVGRHRRTATSRSTATRTAARRAGARCATWSRPRSAPRWCSPGRPSRTRATTSPGSAAAPVEARRSVARVAAPVGAPARGGRCVAGADAAAPWRGGLARGLAPRGRSPTSTAGDRRPAVRRWAGVEAGLADRRVRDAVLVALVPGTGGPARAVRPRRAARRPSATPRSARAIAR